MAHFVRTHEKALANALQLRRQAPKPGQPAAPHSETSPSLIGTYQSPPFSSSASSSSSSSNAFAAAFSLGTLSFASHNIKPAKLTLTPHHLFYLLSRFEEMSIPIGPMNIRLENIHAESSPANYVSFLSQSQRSKTWSDRDSIHSVSSVRSVISGMSALWSNFAIGPSNSAAKTEKAKAQMMADLKYLYSAFTKIPCLRLSPDRRARLIGGFEEFPFDTAVPLLAFKNVSALEICDVDFRQFFGWDKLAEQLRSLTVKRGEVEDPTDLFTGIVLDDMDKRRRRSSKTQSSPVPVLPSSPSIRCNTAGRPSSAPGSPVTEEKLGHSLSPQTRVLREDLNGSVLIQGARTKSTSPSRPTSSKQDGAYRHIRGGTTKVKRSGSGSSNSSTHSIRPYRNGSSSNLLTFGILPASKWRFLRHVSLADNSLISMGNTSLAPLANTLHSLDLSSNLFTEIPDNLASLTALRALNLSNCMIESLHSLTKNPLPAITALNLRANRLGSIAGVERLLSLERLDLRDNKIRDPMEAARLTGIPNIREIWVMNNPFVKTHVNYRVTIFNLFRAVPGSLEDIIIDASGPGYSERRQLRDRVPESESAPIIQPEHAGSELHVPPTLAGSTEMGGHSSPEEFQDVEQQRSSFLKAQSELITGSNRRKKGTRRRIVDLSKDGDPPTLQHELFREPLTRAPSSAYADSRQDDIMPKNKHFHDSSSETQSDFSAPRPPIASSFSSPSLGEPLELSSYGHGLANDFRGAKLSGDAYRQKVEALKSEIGSNWLSVLSEEGRNEYWKSQATSPALKRIDTLRPNLSSLHPASEGIVSGTRALG